jgi:hypothetical protein
MTQVRPLLIVLVALLAVAGAAEASVDLWTPPLFVEGDNRVSCKAFNVSTASRAVHVRIYDFLGHVFETPPAVLLPFTGMRQDSLAGPGAFVCRFTVPTKTGMRASATIFSVIGGSQTDTNPVPAQ